MSMRVTVDGAQHSGNYKCVCECGFAWHGQGERAGSAAFVPTMAIAEGVVHVRWCHAGAGLDLQMSARYQEWLEAHWKRSTYDRHEKRQRLLCQEGRP